MPKKGWNAWIFDYIDWDTQAKALSTLEYTQELVVTKLAHNLLLTRRHMEHIAQGESDICLSCLETIETAPHIFACVHRVQWQATFLDSLREILATLYTQPDLQMILMAGTQGAFQNDPLFDMPTDKHDEACFDLLVVLSQNDIGWSHLLQGRFSHPARSRSNKTTSSIMSTRGAPRKSPANHWLQKVLNHLWTHLYLA